MVACAHLFLVEGGFLVFMQKYMNQYNNIIQLGGAAHAKNVYIYIFIYI